MKNISILVFLFLVGCNKESIPIEILGAYGTSGFGGHEKLTLNGRGEFHIEKWITSCVSTADVDVVGGTFVVKGNWIILKADSSSRRYYEWTNINEKKLISNHRVAIDELTDFNDSIYLLRWNKRLYLLGANAPEFDPEDGYCYNSPLLEFLNSINTGVDKTIRGHEFLTRAYWNKTCETCIESDLRNLLPKNWKDILLDSAIVTQTIKMEPKIEANRIHSYMVTISSGKENGVRTGMIFYGSQCPYHLTIIEVSDIYSKGISSSTCEPQLGLTVSTFTQKE